MADDVKARAELLDATRWANEFAWAEIEALAAHLQLRRRAKGEVGKWYRIMRLRGVT